MLSSSGRSSPSFLFTVGAVVLAVVVYGSWSFLRPTAHSASEDLVREFSRQIGREVSNFRREARELADKRFADKQAKDAAVAAIQEKAEKAIRRIEEQGDQAREELAELDIAIRTQRNRYQRIETREDEAREMVNGVAEDLKARVTGQD
jgi:chromosome segregation ATPase